MAANNRLSFRVYLASIGKGFSETKGQKIHRLVHLIADTWLGHLLFVIFSSYNFARFEQAYIQSETEKSYLFRFYVQKTFPFATRSLRQGFSYKVMFLGLFWRRNAGDFRLLVCGQENAQVIEVARGLCFGKAELIAAPVIPTDLDALRVSRGAATDASLALLRPQIARFMQKRRRTSLENAELALLFASQRINFRFVRQQVLLSQKLVGDSVPEQQLRELEAKINTVTEPYFLGPHNYSRRLATLTDVELATGLNGIFAFLKTRGFEAFINSGTLLGATRSGDLLPHDDDMDLAVHIPGADMAEVGLLWRNLRAELSQAFDFEAKGAFAALHLDSDIQVDLFPAWTDEGKVHIFPYCFGLLKSDDVFPLTSGNLRGIAFPVPANVDKVLSLNYGPNWREPDLYWKFDWNSAMKAFKKSRQYLVSK